MIRYLTLLTIYLFSFQLSAQTLNTTDLSKALTHANKTYGAYCGFAGTHPPTRTTVEELIAQKNVEELSKWLRSPNLVVQTYAAEAFIRLSTEDIGFSEEDLLHVARIKGKEDLIPTCTGCILEKLTIKECLAKIKPGNGTTSESNVR